MGIRVFANSSGIGCGSAATLARQDSCTWLVWVRPETAGGPNGRIFEYANLSGPTVVGCALYHDGTQGTVNLPRITFNRQHVTTVLLRTTSIGIPLNVWTPIAITYNGNSAATGTVIYIGGTAVASYQVSQAGAGAKRNATGNLYVGNNSVGARDWQGSIGQLVVVAEILSAHLIARWAQSKRPFISGEYLRQGSNLIVSYEFQNEFPDGTSVAGSGSIIDRSNNNNHGSPFTVAPTGVAESSVSYQ